MAKIGISLYFDYYSLDECKKQLDFAKKIGYSEIFTSFNFSEYNFPGAKSDTIEKQQELLEYAFSQGMIFHVDITKNLLLKLGGNINDLSCFAKMHLPILRLDDGFTADEVAIMTNNEYGIIIEENLSYYSQHADRIETIKKSGNFKQYYACHNYYPRINTGIDIDTAVEKAKLFRQYGCQTGVFIGSLYSASEINDKGSGILTIEKHRYLPCEVQISELLATGAFDYIIFGDTNPRIDELENVAHANKLWEEEGCIELPCYLDNFDDKTLNLIESTKFVSRVDIPDEVIRACEIRRKVFVEPYHTIERNRYCITIDNKDSNQYAGEMQIPLVDLPPQKNINVIGQVKPYAYRLLNTIRNNYTPFKLKWRKEI